MVSDALCQYKFATYHLLEPAEPNETVRLISNNPYFSNSYDLLSILEAENHFDFSQLAFKEI